MAMKLVAYIRPLAVKKSVFNCAVNSCAAFSTSGCRQDALGFIGLGNMGAHMANNLMKSGKSLVVFDVVKQSMDAALQAGAKGASCPAEVASQCRQVITMLPATPHIKQVYCGEDGILSTVQSGSLLIDCSTIDPSANIEMATASQDKGASYIEAPVSGGVNGARDATLTFMVGGPEASVAQAEPLLKLMGKNIIHCGPVSTGQAAKICNNMMLAISMTGTSEVLNLGIKLGLDPKLLSQILSISSGRTWVTEVYNPCPGVMPGVPSSNEYAGGFGTALMTKDLGLAQNAATQAQVSTPLGSLVHQMYRLMCSGKYGEKDFSSVFKFLQQKDTTK